jgi:DNA-binding NarL/FixJ family response regulator
MPIRVLIGCKQRRIAEAMSEMVKGIKETEVIGLGYNREQILQLLVKEPAQLLLLDLMLPQAEQVAESVKGLHPEVHIILLLEDELTRLRMILQIDALGYLEHSDGKEELERAMQQVTAGEPYRAKALPFDLPAKGSSTENGHAQKASPAENHRVELSKRELEILKMVGQEFSSQEIASSLYISVKTVETHRKNMMKKLGVRSFIGLLKYALKHGML